MKSFTTILFFIICFSISHAEEPDYVDLGLPSGLKWATCNIGANRPEQVGNFYAWGETVSKKKYVIKNYKFFKMPLKTRLLSALKPTLKYLEYISDYSTPEYTSLSQIINLNINDDVSYATYGIGWKIPTKQDYEELIANCISKMVCVDGISCIKLTSKVNGYEDRSICFPLSDFRNDQHGMSHKKNNKKEEAPSGVFCWTSTIRSCQSKDSYAFHSGKYGDTSIITAFRFIGMPIRPVCY